MHRTASPDTSDSAIEHELAQLRKTAPRVTSADIEAEIASEHYFTAVQGADTTRPWGFEWAQQTATALGLLTFCVLVLRNGFTVTGESACASPENFDADIGRKIARTKAIDKCWALLGFRLRDRIVRGEFDGRTTGQRTDPVDGGGRPAYQQRVIDEKADVDADLAKLEAFFATDTFRDLPQEQVAAMSDQAHHMRGYSEALGKRIALWAA